MTLTRIDRVLQAMVKPAIAKGRRSPLLVSLEDGEELRGFESVEVDKTKAQPMDCKG